MKNNVLESKKWFEEKYVRQVSFGKAALTSGIAGLAGGGAVSTMVASSTASAATSAAASAASAASMWSTFAGWPLIGSFAAGKAAAVGTAAAAAVTAPILPAVLIGAATVATISGAAYLACSKGAKIRNGADPLSKVAAVVSRVVFLPLFASALTAYAQHPEAGEKIYNAVYKIVREWGYSNEHFQTLFDEYHQRSADEINREYGMKLDALRHGSSEGIGCDAHQLPAKDIERIANSVRDQFLKLAA